MKIDNDNNCTSKNVKVNIDCSNSFQKIGKLIKVDWNQKQRNILNIFMTFWHRYGVDITSQVIFKPLQKKIMLESAASKCL